MSGAVMFVLGAFLGAGLAWGSVALWLSHGEFIIVDRWWLDNAERWAWFREYELPRSDGSGDA